jgi:hypothetical protein
MITNSFLGCMITNSLTDPLCYIYTILFIHKQSQHSVPIGCATYSVVKINYEWTEPGSFF